MMAVVMGEQNEAATGGVCRGKRSGGGLGRARYVIDDIGPVHLAYNLSYSACFFSRNSIFLS
jgi:hypothetical protein